MHLRGWHRHFGRHSFATCSRALAAEISTCGRSLEGGVGSISGEERRDHCRCGPCRRSAAASLRGENYDGRSCWSAARTNCPIEAAPFKTFIKDTEAKRSPCSEAFYQQRHRFQRACASPASMPQQALDIADGSRLPTSTKHDHWRRACGRASCRCRARICSCAFAAFAGRCRAIPRPRLPAAGRSCSRRPSSKLKSPRRWPWPPVTLSRGPAGARRAGHRRRATPRSGRRAHPHWVDDCRGWRRERPVTSAVTARRRLPSRIVIVVGVVPNVGTGQERRPASPPAGGIVSTRRCARRSPGAVGR